MKKVIPTIIYTITSLFLSRNIMFVRSLSISINRNYCSGILSGQHNFINRFSSIATTSSRARRNEQQILLGNNKIFTNSKLVRNFMNTIYLCKNEEIDTSHHVNINDSKENEESNVSNNDITNHIHKKITTTPKNKIPKRNYETSKQNKDEYKSKPPKINFKKIKIEAKRKTKDWVEHVVVAFSLCPFASKPFRERTLKVVVNFSTDEKHMGLFIIEEMVKLLQSEQTEKSSTLIVAPYFYPTDFFSFMSFVSFFDAEFLDKEKEGSYDDDDDDDEGNKDENTEEETTLGEDDDDDDNEEENYEEEVKLGDCFQVLPFHPHFEFQDSSTSSGVDNYTNRSPYPTFHILREDEVSVAVKLLGGDSSKIWKRNVKLMEAFEERLGLDGVKKIMSVDKEIDDGKLALDVMDVLKENPPFSWGRKGGRTKRR